MCINRSKFIIVTYIIYFVSYIKIYLNNILNHDNYILYNLYLNFDEIQMIILEIKDKIGDPLL